MISSLASVFSPRTRLLTIILAFAPLLQQTAALCGPDKSKPCKLHEHKAGMLDVTLPERRLAVTHTCTRFKYSDRVHNRRIEGITEGATYIQALLTLKLSLLIVVVVFLARVHRACESLFVDFCSPTTRLVCLACLLTSPFPYALPSYYDTVLHITLMLSL